MEKHKDAYGTIGNASVLPLLFRNSCFSLVFYNVRFGTGTHGNPAGEIGPVVVLGASIPDYGVLPKARKHRGE